MAGRKKSQKRSRGRIVAKWLIGSVLVFVLASILVVLPLRWVDPPTSMFILLDDSGVEPIDHFWMPWEQLGDATALAVIGSEDQRFADHRGLDFKAIRAAVEEQGDRGYLRGASTITQQTVKNLYLWPGRSFVRKGLEAWMTLVAELCLSKKRILEIYLNFAEFGPGIYGVGSASDLYFGKTPRDLSDPEAALLATVLPNPKQLRVSAPTDYLRERQGWIIEQIRRLRREGWLTRID